MAAYKNKEELMNTDWQAKINDAKASGDMQAAAIYEQARNDKIKSKDYTGTQKTTNNYSQYLNSGSSGSGSSNDGLHFRGIDYTQTGGGIYGVPTIDSDVKNYTQGGVTYQVGANMARRPDLAGKIAISNGYTVFYDDNGYATKAIKGVADYTPHLDINAGNGTYNSAGSWTDNEILTKNDKDTIDKYRKLASEGKMSWADANAKANAIRSGYGYTIDSKGNVTDLLAKSTVDARRQQWGLDTSSPSDAQQNFVDLWEMINNNSMNSSNVQYDPAPQWNGSEWDNVLNALAEQLLNMNYEDWTKGDQYQALAERYGQQGKMSMQDVLGQVSSRTGGLASSWAQTAANQQYNSFMSQLEDAAMEMYGVERNDLYDRANMARQYADDDYNRYLDDYNRWANNRDFAYNAYRDDVSDQRYADQQSRQQAEDQAKTMAKYGDFSGYKALGYTDAQIALMEAAYQTQNAKKDSGGGGNPTVSQDYAGLFQAAYDAGENANSFIANNYGDYGFDKSTGLYDEFTQAVKTPVKSGLEMNAANFNATMQSISAQLQAGKEEAALSNVNSVWANLSGQQKRQLQDFLKNYGIAYQP